MYCNLIGEGRSGFDPICERSSVEPRMMNRIESICGVSIATPPCKTKIFFALLLVIESLYFQPIIERNFGILFCKH